VGSNLLPESMTARPYRDFLGTLILELFEDVPLNCGAGVVVSVQQSCSVLWGRRVHISKMNGILAVTHDSYFFGR
jgi:hypothetical protein